ncbi:MAG: cyclase [Flavobacteriales bacterium]|nr:cyclase [Flavobacteriales bacterium]
MEHLLIRHKVADFKKWKEGYDGDLSHRQKAGLKEEKLMRNADNPNDVLILFEVADRQRAEAFAKSPELKSTMEKYGVQGAPDAVFLN